MKSFYTSLNGLGYAGFLKRWVQFMFLIFVFGTAFSQMAFAQSTIVVNSEQNNVPIQEVRLIVDRGGPDEQIIVQTTQGLPNPLPVGATVEVESILLQNGDRIFATTRFPTVKSANPLLGSGLDPSSIRVIKHNHTATNQHIPHSNNLPAFLAAMGEVVSTPNLRSYWDIGNTTILKEDSSFVDIIYPIQLPRSGYMMVSERNGNSAFDLLPLNQEGNVITNATIIQVREQFDWNTGVNHQIDVVEQKQWLTIIKPELFNVDEPIYGFRVFDIGESDGKFIFFAREVSAAPDFGGPVFGFFGEENVVNIFDNDELDGEALNSNEVILSIIDNEGAIANGFLILDTDPNSPTFGRVSVPPGTPPGIYTFEYEIEDILDGRKDRAVVTIRVVDPIDGPDFPDCRDGFDCEQSSDKITLEGIFLTDAFGNPVSSTCELGTNKEVYLSLSIASNTDQPLYESRFIADLKIGDNSLLLNAFLGTIEPNESSQIRIVSEAFLWNCGDEIRMDDILIIWLGEEPDVDNPVEDCEPYEEGQCISEFIVGGPLSADFDWIACELDDTFTFNFSSFVSGGFPSIDEDGKSILGYIFNWDFNNDGVVDSEEANPTFVYTDTNASEVRLEVFDASGNSFSVVKPLEYPAAIEIIETIVKPNPGQNDGKIEINVENGVGELDIEWFVNEEVVGNGPLLENIGACVFTVVVRDENGCEVSSVFEVVEKEFPFRDLRVSKQASVSTFEAVGELIVYTITVTNTGNVVLENIQVEDPLTGLSETIEVLEVGEANSVVFTTEYLTTQADVDLGRVVNVVLISSDDIETSDEETITAVQQSGISITKTADRTEVQDAGDVINYTITVINTGNTTLTDVLVRDPLTGLEEVIDILLPGEERVLNTSYTVTLEDELALVPIVNFVLVTAKDPSDKDVKDGDEIEVEVICVDKTRIQGIVFNEDTGEPLSKVPVLLIPQTGTPGDVIMQITGDNGAYFFTGIAPGKYLVQVQDVNLNITQDLYPVESSLLFADVVFCEYVFHDFAYAVTNEPVIGDFVWYDLNANGIQDEWFDANNDGFITQNIPDENGYVPFDQWEWIDLNGDGRFDGPENEGELNKAGIGNALNPNIFAEGPGGSITEAIIGINGYYRVRPGALGDYSVRLDLDDNLLDAAKELARSGRVKVIPNQAGRILETESEIEFAGCGLTTDNPYEFECTCEVMVRLDIDFGIFCEEQADLLEIIANDDDFGVHPANFTGVLGNILENDLLEGERPNPNDVDFEFTELDGIIGLNIDENGELSLLIPDVNERREYVLRYVLRETANPTNQDDAVVIFRLVENQVNLSVEKTSNAIEIFEGDEFQYFITVSNNGDSDANNVEIIDELPIGVAYLGSTFVSSDPSVQVTTEVLGNRVVWNIEVLPAGASIEFTLNVRAEPLTGENPLTITNRVTVTAEEEDSDPNDNSDTDVNIIRPFFIPNVITPDGDGRNDTFEIKGLSKFPNNEIVIFNRYGDHVYETVNYRNDWAAEGLVAGTYMYVLKATDQQGRRHEFKGWIQVIK